jgi:hypothetical protein
VDLAETVGTYCEWVAALKKAKLPSAGALEPLLETVQQMITVVEQVISSFRSVLE